MRTFLKVGLCVFRLMPLTAATTAEMQSFSVYPSCSHAPIAR
jgi:hypothetical protein